MASGIALRRRSPRATAAVPVVLGGLLGACLGPVAPLYPPAPGEPATAVWVVDHGWHVGLVLDRASMPAGLVPEQRDLSGARYLEFGWGDDAFYRAPEGTSGLALRAALASPRSVLHVAGLHARFDGARPADGIVAIRLSRPGVAALTRFVHDSFARGGAERVAPLGRGLSPSSLFYPARGRYHLLNTCNTWVARALRAAGCPITPAWALTAGNLMWQARRAAEAPAARPGLR
jgi:uncharacterized protein (TIGR02117 family)